MSTKRITLPRLSKADGLFLRKPLIIRHVLKSLQSMQVVIFFSLAHLRISHICSQNIVFVPFSRQPSQLMCSGRIGALFIFAHSAAVFSLKARSSVMVAIYASHFSQSSPQYPILLFTFYPLISDNAELIAQLNFSIGQPFMRAQRITAFNLV